MSVEKQKQTEIQQAQPYLEMEVRDEKQVLAELRSEMLETFVYSFKQGDRQITNLSYAGIKEAVRLRGNITLVGEPTITETDHTIRAMVKIHDCVNNVDFLGVSEADKTKPFAFVLAVNKAERNAYAKLLPGKYFAELVKQWLNEKRGVVIDVKPEAAKTVNQPTEETPLMYRLAAEIPAELSPLLEIEEQTDQKRIIVKNRQKLELDDYKYVCRFIEKFGGTRNKEENLWAVPLA